MRSIGPKLSMKASRVVYEFVGLLSTRSCTWESGLKIQIFDVKFANLKHLQKPAFSAILHTPGIPRFPSPGVMPVHPRPGKLLYALSGLAPSRRILDLVPRGLYFGNRIFTIFLICQNLSNFSWKIAVQGTKSRKKSNFPKCPSSLFYLPLSVPNTFPVSLSLVWVPQAPPCVK